MNRNTRFTLFTLLALASTFVIIGFALYIIFILQGADIPVLNPKGTIAHKERALMIDATLLMLLVVVPVFILAFTFAWKYRESNDKAKYSPNLDRHPAAEFTWWGIPLMIIIVLAVLTWFRTHELDPFKPLESTTKPIKVQVVALDWKWLFIYPEENIASVNFFQFPEKTPLNFEITADAPMNSFWIPQLGGQMYAMPGMKSQLHLIADDPGSFYGSSANLSGKGFAGMVFTAKASSQSDYEQWVTAAKQSTASLDLATYKKLAEPSEYNSITTYVLNKDDLFDWIVMKYMMPMKTLENKVEQ